MAKRATNDSKRTPNSRLREERERRGMAHKDVAEAIGLPDPHTVGRWERGISFPQPHYRQKLCRLFGKSAEELGLVRTRSAEDGQQRASASSVRTQAFPSVWNLPPSFTSFIGRERDSASLCALLTRVDVRLVTLVGPGGVGKTRLSMQVASELRAAFADGVCFISLVSVSNSILVLPTIAHALGIRESGLPLMLEQMKEVLRAARCLLILDNFEQVMTAAPLVEELLVACPGLKVLVTSRAVLHLQMERTCFLEPLAVPDAAAPHALEPLLRSAAVALFVERARAFVSTFEPTDENIQTIAEICRRLDGLPLALELAASRIKLLPPKALLARLSQDFHLLKNEVQGHAQRQQTLAATIKWSYDLLNEREQWLFRRLCIFPGGCTLQAAETMLSDVQALELLELFASLIDKSLIRQVERDSAAPRYAMLETVRAYGLTCLEALQEKEESQQAQARYYLALLEQARPHLSGRDQMTWMALLEKEKENLRAVIAYLIERAEAELALHFCESFGKFCGLSGYWLEEHYWLHAALGLPWAASATAIRGKVLRRAGHLAYRLRNLSQARSLLEESVRLSRSVEDDQNAAGALSSLGWVLYRQRDIDGARRLLRESVIAARKAGDKWAIANSLESLGRLAYLQDSLDEASQLLSESVALSREVGDQENLARILVTLVSIEIAQDHIAQADLLVRESYELARELGARPLLALVLDSQASVAFALGEYDRATDLLEERMRMSRELDDTPTVNMKQLHLGDLALIKGDPMRAAALVHRSLAFLRAQGDVPNVAVALSILGDITRSLGKFKQALELYKEALVLAGESEQRKGAGRPFLGIAVIALNQGLAREATLLLGFVASPAISLRGMPAAQRLAHEQVLEQARSRLTTQDFATAWSRGHAMTFDETLTLAFSVN